LSRAHRPRRFVGTSAPSRAPLLVVVKRALTVSRPLYSRVSSTHSLNTW
jgi:hypothetical protein